MTSATEEDGFYGYDPTTKDPGFAMLGFTIAFCVLSNLMLPCLVIMGQKYERRRLLEDRKNKELYGDEEEEKGETEPEAPSTPEVEETKRQLGAEAMPSQKEQPTYSPQVKDTPETAVESPSPNAGPGESNHIHFRHSVMQLDVEGHEDKAQLKDEDDVADDVASVTPSSYVHGRNAKKSADATTGAGRTVYGAFQSFVDKVVMPPYPDDVDGSMVSGSAFYPRLKHDSSTRSQLAESQLSARSRVSEAPSLGTSVTTGSAATTSILDAGVRRGRRRGTRPIRGAADLHIRTHRLVEAENHANGDRIRREEEGVEVVASAVSGRSQNIGQSSSIMRGQGGSHVQGSGAGTSDLGSRLSRRSRASRFPRIRTNHSSDSNDSVAKKSLLSGLFRRHRSGSPQPSALSKIVDDISPDDAADAGDPGVFVIPKEEDVDKEPLDLCCGERAFWKPRFVMQAFDRMVALAEFDMESRRIVKLAVPFTVAQFMEEAFVLVNIALISKYLGTGAVSAYAVVDVLIGLSSEFLGGIVDSEATLLSHAIGAGNNKLAGQYVQISTIFYIVCSIPFIAMWSLITYDVMKWFGFDDEVSRLGQDYANIAVYVELIEGVASAFHGLLEVTDRECFSAFIGVLEGAVEVGLLVIMLTQFDGIDLQDVAIMYIVLSALFFLFTVLYTLYKGWIKPFLNGMFGSFAFRNRRAVTVMLKTATPLAIGSLLAYGEWEVLTVFAAALGPAEVATWAIVGAIWDTFEATTEGLGDAGEVRCAFHLGKGNWQMARISSYKSIMLGIMASFIVTSAFFIMGEDLPTWFTSDPALQHMMADVLPYMGIGNISMAFGTMCWALVGAQGRYRLATFVAFVASWCITLPLGALFVYGLNFNLKGLTAAVVVGYSVTGTVLSYILIRSDWERLAKIVQELNAITGEVESDDESSDSSSSSSEESSDDDTTTRNGSSLVQSSTNQSSMNSRSVTSRSAISRSSVAARSVNSRSLKTKSTTKSRYSM